MPALNREDLDTYLFHRLSMAGHTMGNLFNKKARDVLFKASKGIPRVVNILCHKALLIAYGKGEHNINDKIMRLAIKDTDLEYISDRYFVIIILTAISVVAILMVYFYQGII